MAGDDRCSRHCLTYPDAAGNCAVERADCGRHARARHGSARAISECSRTERAHSKFQREQTLRNIMKDDVPHQMNAVIIDGAGGPDVLRMKPQPTPVPKAGELLINVAAVGEGVTEWKVGDAVCALTPGGGYAEFAVAPASSCLPIPRGLTVAEAA